jgi:hypothetical protein
LVIEVDQLDDAGMARELEQLGFPPQPSSPLVVVCSLDRDGLSAGTDLDAHLLAHSAVPPLSADRRATHRRLVARSRRTGLDIQP